MRLHHLGDIDSTATTAILTGDPDRVPLLADHLGKVVRQWSQRGYVLAETEVEGQPLLVCSTGIGGPSTAIAVEELAQLGVTRFVRVGTCGSIQRHINAGHVVISTGCVRDEGTSHQYLPPEYPAVPDFFLLRAIVDAAVEDGHAPFVGPTHCKDAYYAEKPDGFPLAGQWRERWAGLRASRVLATEMEAATLFAVATARDVRAAALFVATDDTLSPERTREILCAVAASAVRGALSTDADSDTDTDTDSDGVGVGVGKKEEHL
ncbi:nucleoside phosphorylase [Streptomyces sp. NBC_01275]|uniref:nucleoside phosphorylase n=1 Tax=Streptomyces sp. NBC_01275 TaxID=2903807 RepID=UPI002256AE44|nr:nucleoside phosphorylase [Streptomyces sp. NBC_01275]MCX4763831.1 nucleoside phosphorylase [Streptomyces sp. NBC_01275]